MGTATPSTNTYPPALQTSPNAQQTSLAAMLTSRGAIRHWMTTIARSHMHAKAPYAMLIAFFMLIVFLQLYVNCILIGIFIAFVC